MKSTLLMFIFTRLVIIINFVFIGTLVNEIHAREAIKPPADVADIVKDFNNLHINLDGAAILAVSPCLIDVQKDLPKANQAQPLYLRPNSEEYWLPNAKGQLEIPYGAPIELHCSKSFANGTNEAAASAAGNGEIIFRVAKHTRTLRPRCLQGTKFTLDDGKYEFRQFVCEQPPKFTVERLHRNCGNDDDGAEIFRIGYNITRGRFIETMQVCHVQESLRTHYVRHLMQPANVHFQKHVKRLNFSRAGYFESYNMNHLYSHYHQRQQVVKLLGVLAGMTGGAVDINATMMHLFDNSSLSLSRGHLAAKADLIYGSQQRTTFTYFNAAPQWQSFNGGQWLAVEDEVRKYISRLGHQVICYTGTWGVMQLGNDGNGPDFYLTTDANNNGVLPVPKLYYRVIVEVEEEEHVTASRQEQQRQQQQHRRSPRRGLALVGVNNPHATQQQIDSSYIICADVREQVPWLQRWMRNKSLKKGYLYACSVADLTRAVGHLPKELEQVTELLI